MCCIFILFIEGNSYHLLCHCYPIEENIPDSIVFSFLKEIPWNKLCHHCQRGKQIWRKILCKSLWSLSKRKYILSLSLLSYLDFFVEGNPVIVLLHEKKNTCDCIVFFLEKSLKKLQESLWSDREINRRLHSLLLHFFIERNPVNIFAINFICGKHTVAYVIEGNSCGYSDVLVFAYVYRENIPSLHSSLILCFLIEGKILWWYWWGI